MSSRFVVMSDTHFISPPSNHEGTWWNRTTHRYSREMGEALVKLVRDKYGITFAGGQGELSGKIIRIAHLGHCDDLDIVAAISALEMALPELGHNVPSGAGVCAAEKVLREQA